MTCEGLGLEYHVDSDNISDSDSEWDDDVEDADDEEFWGKDEAAAATGDADTATTPVTAELSNLDTLRDAIQSDMDAEMGLIVEDNDDD